MMRKKIFLIIIMTTGLFACRVTRVEGACFSLRLLQLSKCSALITNYKKKKERGRKRGEREGGRLRNEVLLAYTYNPSTWR